MNQWFDASAFVTFFKWKKNIFCSGFRAAVQVPADQVADLLARQLSDDEAVLAHVVSGFPRTTSDLVNYLERPESRIDGVILINWHEEAIRSQVEYGAKEGQINLSAAKTELKHFKKHVIPVAEFFDFKNLLYVVSLFHNQWIYILRYLGGSEAMPHG